jgi:rubrerythrin
MTPEIRAKIDRVVATGSAAEARAILGAECDRLLAERAEELLERMGTGRPSVWDETLCQSCGRKLEDPRNTTRCAPCAAARMR